jgi:hypothetical protein
MNGISASCSLRRGSFLPIVMQSGGYTIEWYSYEYSTNDKQLQTWTEGILAAFKTLEREVNKRQSIYLEKDLCDGQLTELAKWGGRAYSLFFSEEARQHLMDLFQDIEHDREIPAPTFISKTTPFPWEVLYEGQDYRTLQAEEFWGLAYSPARILNPAERRPYPKEQTLPLDMLFCLHQKLRHAHQKEWPEIARQVKATHQDRFLLLGPLGNLLHVSDGETLLEYLDSASHNMLHFACHCKHREAGADALLVSLIDEEGNEVTPLVIELGIYSFVDIKGHFSRSPLVFLNACQSGGDSGELQKIFNLPKVFVERGAAAIIATACPVPDLFAAAFAKVFYKFFLRGHEVEHPQTGETYFKPMTIGEALQATRWYFLDNYNNPLGLAYGLYSPAYYQLAQPPAGGRVYE